MPKPERDALDELINTIPVNIERLIRGQGIKLNTNARPEDFNLNKKPKTEFYKDSLGRRITVTFLEGNVRIKTGDKKIEEIITKKSFESRRKYWEPIK
jgi:hypothetical protein